jgi:hypothetical protein
MTYNEVSRANLNPLKYPSLGTTTTVKIPSSIKSQLLRIVAEFDRIYDEVGSERGEHILDNLVDQISHE